MEEVGYLLPFLKIAAGGYRKFLEVLDNKSVVCPEECREGSWRQGQPGRRRSRVTAHFARYLRVTATDWWIRRFK